MHNACDNTNPQKKLLAPNQNCEPCSTRNRTALDYPLVKTKATRGLAEDQMATPHPKTTGKTWPRKSAQIQIPSRIKFIFGKYTTFWNVQIAHNPPLHATHHNKPIYNNIDEFNDDATRAKASSKDTTNFQNPLQSERGRGGVTRVQT